MIYTDISIDLETLDTTPRAVILSIAAVAFNRFTGEIDEGKEWHVDVSKQPNRTIGKNTLIWWLGQEEEARDAIMVGQGKSEWLEIALAYLECYIVDNSNPVKVNVWGNGPSFDNAILSDAYGGNVPWKFWNDRCLRTLLAEHERSTGIKLKDTVPFEGERHGALADARHQAKLLIEASKN